MVPLAVLGLDGLATGAGKMWRDPRVTREREKLSHRGSRRERERERDPEEKDRLEVCMCVLM